MSQQRPEISIQEVAHSSKLWLAYFKSKWMFLFLISLLGAGVGLGYALLRTTYYTATTTFVLEEDAAGGAGGLGQYAGLAAMVGIDLGGNSSGIFQGENIAALYKSRLMVERTLLTRMPIKGKQQFLIDYYVDFTGLRKKWAKKPQFKNLVFTDETGKPETRLADSLITKIVEDINKKYLNVGKIDKKLNLIGVDFTAENEDFARLFNVTLVQTVNEFYIQTKTKKSLDNIKVLQHQTDSVKRVMNGAISNAAQIVDVTPNLNITRQSQRSAPVQRSQFTAEANKAILTELVKNLELSKMNFLKNKPLIQVIDEPIYPLKDDKPGKIKMTVYGLVLGLVFALLGLTFTRFYKQLFEPALK